VTEKDVLGASEAARRAFDYFARTPELPRLVQKLAATEPELLACMHGSAWRGDGAQLLRELGRVLTA
jgi:hypothetical protein